MQRKYMKKPVILITLLNPISPVQYLFAWESTKRVLKNLLVGGDIYPGTIAFINFIGRDSTFLKSTWPPMERKDPIDIRLSVEAWMLLSLDPEMLVVEDFTKDRRSAIFLCTNTVERWTKPPLKSPPV